MSNEVKETTRTSAYEDVTEELGQFRRGLLISNPSNCPSGLYVGGVHDGQTWLRRYVSPTMRNEGDDENIYYRTGEIFYKEPNYYVVYRPFISQSASKP